MEEKTLFEDLKEGLEEAIAYSRGEDTGAYVVIPKQVNVREIRRKLEMTQEGFSQAFDIPLPTLRKWEQNQRQPERLARAFFKVLEHNPTAVLEAMGVHHHPSQG